MEGASSEWIGIKGSPGSILEDNRFSPDHRGWNYQCWLLSAFLSPCSGFPLLGEKHFLYLPFINGLVHLLAEHPKHLEFSRITHLESPLFEAEIPKLLSLLSSQQT